MRRLSCCLSSCSSVLALVLGGANAFAQAAPVTASAAVTASPVAPASSTASAPVAPVAAAAPPAAPAGSGDTHLDLVTLKVLRDRGQISEADYDSAIKDMRETTSEAVAADAPTFVLGKFSTTIYGVVKTDLALDSTESFGDLAGNAQVQRPGGSPLAPSPAPQITYAGDHSRVQYSIHDTRFGFRFRSPESASGVRVGGLMEFDFFGQLPPTASEAQVFDSSVLRVRHAYFRVETPVVDLLVGQYWHLFGWQNLYHPASVQAQGLAGEVYSRSAQVRLSKTITTPAVTFEIAAAALRPPQRDAGKPQAEGGIRFAVNKWTGVMTNGAAGTGIQPLSVAVTGNFRDFTVPEMNLLPQSSVDKGALSLAVDALVPVIPATKEKKDNALTLNGEFATGQGGSDLYTALTGGLAFAYLPNTTNLNPAPTYPQNVDNGMVAFDTTGNLHAIQWTSYLVGLQYYLPIANGRVFIAGNYSHMQSSNIASFTQSFATAAPDPTAFHFVSDAQVRKSLDFFDGMIFIDAWTGVRFGVEYAHTIDHYVDGVKAQNDRVQGAGMFMF